MLLYHPIDTTEDAQCDNCKADLTVIKLQRFRTEQDAVTANQNPPCASLETLTEHKPVQIYVESNAA